LQVWHLFLLAIIAGAATAANAPVRQSFIVELVGDKKDLANAIGLNSTTINAAATIGPALGGVAIAAVGEAGAFFVNGLTFTAMIAALLLMRTRPAVPVQEQTGLGSHVKEGFLFAFKHRSLLILFSLVAVAAFLSRPYVLLLPIFADDVLSASAQPLLEFACGGENALFNCQSDNALIFGVLMAAVGVGSVLGALGVASLSKRAVRGRWMLSMYLCFTLLLIGLALSRSFVLSLLLLVGIGFSFVFQNALTNTLVQLISPDHVRGRISSFYSLIFVGMTQLGGIQAGLVGDHLSAPMAVGLGAILCLAYGVIIILRFPHIRKMS